MFELARVKVTHSLTARLSTGVLVLSASVLGAALFTVSPAQADAQINARTAHSALVSENASFFTPSAVDGRVEAIAVEGDTVFVGGTFTQVQMALDGEVVDQPYLFAYSKSTGAIIRDFDPVLNRPVRALQTTGEGTGIFVGGDFSVVNGETNRKGLVKLDDLGERVPSFRARIDKRVYAMDRSGSTLYLGGNFERISGVPVEYLAAVDTTTGEVQPGINFDFDGVFSTTRNQGFGSVDVIEVTSDDQLMVITGNFRTIDGISRSRLAVIELGAPAVVSDWNTDVFDVDCPAQRDPQYVEGVDISPDNTYFVTGTTGAGLIGDPACDTVLRFDFADLTDTQAQPTWIAYTGGDTVYEVAISEHAVYAGGHFRWFNNGHAQDRVGPGSVERRGLAALDPLNGLPLLNWRSDRNPRGIGTFALEVHPEGLYIGDDTDFLNGFEHPKFKFLPITTDTIERPNTPTLPTTVFSTDGVALSAFPFDGTTMSSRMTISGTGWENTRGAMFLDGQLFHAGDSGNMWVSEVLDDNTLGARTEVDLFGLTSNEWDLARLGGMFFNHEQGRVYYSLEGDPDLYWRAFTPSGPVFGDFEFVAQNPGDIPWGDVRGMDVIDGQLYFGLTDGSLYSAALDGSSPITGTTQLVSGPFAGALNPDNPFLAFYSEGAVLPASVTPPANAQACAVENGLCELPLGATATVYYGAEDSFVALAGLSGTVSCDSETFGGDPLFGTIKACSYALEADTTFFESAGSSTLGRWQVFSFDVSAGEQVNVEVNWDDPNAEVRVFLRDQDRKGIARYTLGGSPARLSTVAQISGLWSIAVQIRSGSTNYDIAVSTSRNIEPRADHEFSSSGSVTSGRWQVFRFDVIAGQQVNADVVWDDPAADIRLLLRDENNNQLDINTGGIGEGSLSATAATSGRWSVVVRINGGSSDYSVTVNKTPAPDTDGDGVIDIVDAFPNDPDEIRDADADGIGDNADATPFGDNVALSSVNSALGKAASQSSQISGNAASRAVDGITVGDNSQFTHTLREFQPWWQVRLDRSTDIGLIRLYNRTGCCSERLSNVHILVSNEDMSEFSLASLLENDNVSKAFISGPAGEIADIESIGTGRFIRIQLEATNYLSLAEVEVYEALLP